MGNKNLNIPVRNADKKISGLKNVDLSPEEVAVLKNTIGKGLTDVELAYFLGCAKSVGLSPYMGEIWAYKDNRGNLIIFAGRDGFLSCAQRNTAYNGIRSCEVRENDEFSADIPNGDIFHTIKHKTKEKRGKITCAYAIAYRKDGEPTIEIADFETYNKGKFVWNTHPADMVKKVAELKALKKAFGISLVQSEYDFDVVEGIAVPINTELNNSLISELSKEILECNEIDKLKGIKLMIENDHKELMPELMDGLSTKFDQLNKPTETKEPIKKKRGRKPGTKNKPKVEKK